MSRGVPSRPSGYMPKSLEDSRAAHAGDAAGAQVVPELAQQYLSKRTAPCGAGRPSAWHVFDLVIRDQNPPVSCFDPEQSPAA